MEKNVLLLGANGQLGSLIKGCAPSSVNLSCPTSSELDITNRADVVNALAELKPEIIINASAYTLVDKAEEESEKAYLINDRALEIIAKAVNEASQIIHFSTDFVFDGSKSTPYEPSDLTSPKSIYGKSKLAGENKLLTIKPDSSIIIRTAWLYSATGKNFVNTMLQLMSARDELSVVADQFGTPTSAHTLAKVAWKFAEGKCKSGIYHWTDKGETSWFEFACAIQEIALDIGLLGKEITIKAISTEEYPTPASRPSYSVLDKGSAYDAIGFEGKSWQAELRDVLLKINSLSS